MHLHRRGGEAQCRGRGSLVSPGRGGRHERRDSQGLWGGFHSSAPVYLWLGYWHQIASVGLHRLTAIAHGPSRKRRAWTTG